MNCQRCGGLLVSEIFGELSMEMARMYPAMRCINCGCIEDPWFRRQSPAAFRGNLVGASGDGQEGKSGGSRNSR